MRIWCQLPTALPRDEYAAYYQLLEDDLGLVKRADTEVSIRDVPTGLRSPELSVYFGLREANNHEVLRTMVQAENEGYDAVSSLCYGDSAVKAAASLMDIPVVGPGECSMLLASMMGSRFAIVTTDPTPETERYIDQYGMRSRVLAGSPVRRLTMDGEAFLACLGGDYGPAVESFVEVARGCVADGADVVIAGCGLLSPMLSMAGVYEVAGVPVIDPVRVSLKFAEMMVDLKIAGMLPVSHRGLYLRGSRLAVNEALRALGMS